VIELRLTKRNGDVVPILVDEQGALTLSYLQPRQIDSFFLAERAETAVSLYDFVSLEVVSTPEAAEESVGPRKSPDGRMVFVEGRDERAKPKAAKT
jgi:hypothetical protein